MPKKVIALIALLMMTLASSASAQMVEQIERTDYENAPFMVSVPTIPQVLLILSKNIQMFQQAYPGLVDMDGDNVVDTGFNPAVVYTGYFDPYSCYGYDANYTRKYSTSSSLWSTGDPNGVFRRVAQSVPDFPLDADGNVVRPAELKGYVKSPVSATGICKGVEHSYGSYADVTSDVTDDNKYNQKATFSGNWLNYVTTSRMDAIRKILYGGTRVQPEPATGSTYLEPSFVPHDSTAWGTEVMADDRWDCVEANGESGDPCQFSGTPKSVYYDITKYTPFDKPTSGKAHFFSRTRNRDANAPFQAFRVLPNIDGTSTFFNIGGSDSTGERIQNIKGRFWDWALSGRPVPDDRLLQEISRRSIRVYRLRIEACGLGKEGRPLDSEGCMQYPNGQYKPTGLLQKYGQGGLMSFGLLTGTYNSNIRRQGGVVRNHISDISQAVDPQNGTIIKNGMISNMDRLMVSGRYIKTLEGWPAGGSYYDNYSWGNPVGEMLYEGVRYFASLTRPDGSELKPTPAYATDQSDNDASSGQSASMGVSPIKELTRKTSWTTDGWPERPFLRAADCAKPVILLISDITPEYDGDTAVNGSSDLNLKELGATGTTERFSMSGYLDTITSQEGMKGGQYFYSTGKSDDCSANTLNSLNQVKGICPGGPAFEGTYSAAAVAYYAHTHDFSPGENEAGIDIYSVTMSSAFPELTFKNGTDGSDTITIMPVNMSSKSSAVNMVLSFLNYYIIEWHTDKDGNPFSATIQVNFSDDKESDDWEMDVIATYRIDLLTVAGATNATSGSLFNTTGKVKPKPNDCASDYRLVEARPFPSPCPTPPPVSGVLKTAASIDYYGFANNYKSAAYTPVTVSSSDVRGLSVYTKIEKKGTGVHMSLGYTISGSNQDGTYLEVGLSGTSGTLNPPYQTPPTCPRPNGPTGSPERCGTYHTTQAQIRTFTFAGSSAAKFLPNPLFLAAKYGGFKDPQHTGVPRTSTESSDIRWSSRRPGVPDNYFQATNISELSAQLGAAFQAIAKSVSTGTATAASVSSVLGGGVSIQTLFYPEYAPLTTVGEDGKATRPINWVGNIYGLFSDKFGNLREDTNENQQLDNITGDVDDAEEGDLVVEFVSVEVFNELVANDKAESEEESDNGSSIECVPPKAQWEKIIAEHGASDRPYLFLCRDIKGDGMLLYEKTAKNLEELKTLWNTSDQLANMTDNQAATGRGNAETGDGYDTGAQAGRYIMTYFGKVPANPEDGWDQGPVPLKNFQFHVDNAAELRDLMLQNSALTVGQAYPKSGTNKLYIRGYGQLPKGVETIKAQIKKSSANRVTASMSGGSGNLMITIEVRDGTTAAELVEIINAVAASDSGIYNGAPIIRASLVSGDLGSWKVPFSGSGNEEVYDIKDVEDYTADLIQYIRGMEKEAWRARVVPSPWQGEASNIVWRMGDIINSKPVIVGAPSSQFDYMYRDTSYATYKLAQGRRRQVAYVGSNDGMLHAINVGFFGSLKNGAAGYSETSFVEDITPTPEAHPLGAELWAFVPRAVLPHLQWLADPEYDHSYYVDLMPQIVDIKNTTGRSVSMPVGSNWGDNEWRTVLIGGLRLGGRTIRMNIGDPDTPPEHSYSEFFALDVTDPEKPPVLLWRYSSKELGLSSSLPAVVSSRGQWYVVLGSGPTSDRQPQGDAVSGGKIAYDGFSTQNARLIILDAITGKRVRTVVAEKEERSFFNDSFTPIASQVRGRGSAETQWDNSMVYFGLTKSLDTATGKDEGAVYRLQMVDETTGEAYSNVNDWKLARFFKTDRPVLSGSLSSSRPVTGAVNSARDSRRNTWVLFGTGRMWSKDDAAPCQGISEGAAYEACQENHEHYIYGLKEPMSKTSSGVWLMDFSEITDSESLLDVSQVEVYSNGAVHKFSGGSTYTALQNFLSRSDAAGNPFYQGYRRKLATASIGGDTGAFVDGTQEVCLYQPAIDGLPNGQSLAAFTTYVPNMDICDPEGHSYLHVIDTFTGVPAPYMYDMTNMVRVDGKTDDSSPDDPGKLVTGFTGAGTGKATKAMISNGRVETNAQDGSNPFMDFPQLALTSGVISWREILDMGFTLEKDQMYLGIEGLDSSATPPTP